MDNDIDIPRLDVESDFKLLGILDTQFSTLLEAQ